MARGRSDGSPSTWSSHRQPGAADLVDQRVEVAEAGLGDELGVVVGLAHRAQEVAHLGEGGTPGLLDAEQGAACRRPARPGRLWRTAPTCSTITLTEWATMSCSSRAIRARSSATAMRAAVSALPLGVDGASLGGLGLGGPAPKGEAGEPGDGEQPGHEHVVGGRPGGAVVDDDRCPDDRDDETDPRLTDVGEVADQVRRRQGRRSTRRTCP